MAATIPRTGYAPVNGLDMYYEVHGQGAPLVLLHGAYSNIQTDFGQLIPGLAKTRRVIGVEQQAHGHTADIDRPLSYEQMADDTAALTRADRRRAGRFLRLQLRRRRRVSDCPPPSGAGAQTRLHGWYGLRP